MSDSSDVTTTETFGDRVKKFFQMEPALFRGLLVALALIVAQALKGAVDLMPWVDLLVNLFTALGAVLAAWWTRGVVVPSAKVLAFKQPSGEIVPGQAVATTPSEVEATIDAAVLKEAA